MSDPNGELMDAVFGPGDGTEPRDRARQSSRVFVRGLDLLTVERSGKETGRRLTALEALDAYGYEKLCEVAREGSGILTSSVHAVGRTLRNRREELGLPLTSLASRAGLSRDVVTALEQSRRRPIREYERAARILGLDERQLSFNELPTENERIAVRLRTLSEQLPSLSPSTVANLSEAAWVAMTQVRLERQLELADPDYVFEESHDFGGLGGPAYEVGYDLAQRVRDRLGLDENPIPSMRALAEDTLGFTVIQANLDEDVAGATIETDGHRAIVLNLIGRNSQAAVRRSTLAHELCHILFDPSADLNSLRVDNYEDLDRRPDQTADRVEQRANAFSIELLAPQAAAVERYRNNENLFRAVLDYFGVSFTAGRYQVWNGLDRSVPLESIKAPHRPPEQDWDGKETFTVDYHPVRALGDVPARAGKFSAVVVRAARDGIISWDTAGEWLASTEKELKDVSPFMVDLYPSVFP